MTTNTSDRQLVTVVLLVLAALIVLPMLFAGVGMMTGGPMAGGPMGVDWTGEWGHGATVWWVAVIALVMRALLFVALLVGAYYVYRAVTDGSEAATPRTGARTDPAMAELRRAYARGDLTDEEFERRRERLLETDDRDR